MISFCSGRNSPKITVLGFVDILGTAVQIQQDRIACRPVRDVSRLNLVINKTGQSAKSRAGPRRTLMAYQVFFV